MHQCSCKICFFIPDNLIFIDLVPSLYAMLNKLIKCQIATPNGHLVI